MHGENLQNPARERRAGAMRWFRTGQVNSTKFSTGTYKLYSTAVLYVCIRAGTKFSTTHELHDSNDELVYSAAGQVSVK